MVGGEGAEEEEGDFHEGSAGFAGGVDTIGFEPTLYYSVRENT